MLLWRFLNESVAQYTADSVRKNIHLSFEHSYTLEKYNIRYFLVNNDIRSVL